MLTITEKEAYCRSLQPLRTRRAKAGSRYVAFPQDVLSKLEKWPSFPSHLHPSPGYAWIPFLNPSNPGCIPPLGLLGCLDILCGASFSLLIFPLLLKEMTWQHVSRWNQVLGVSSLGQDQEMEGEKGSFSHCPKVPSTVLADKAGHALRSSSARKGKTNPCFWTKAWQPHLKQTSHCAQF